MSLGVVLWVAMIMTQPMLPTTPCTKRRYALQIANHPRAVINILRVAFRASMERALVDMLALIADGDFHIDAEVVAASTGSSIDQRQRSEEHTSELQSREK